jgi:hypothetical protein
MQTVSSMAQKEIIFNIPGNIPKPCWVDKIDWKKANLFAIEEAVKSCGETKTKDLETDDIEADEEPYELALRRWLDETSTLVLDNGDIVTDHDSARRVFNRLINDQEAFIRRRQATSISVNSVSSAQSGTADWSVLGPVQTYEAGVKKNWQANIYSLAIAPSDTRVLYCGSETGIIFKSVDKGLNWSSVSDALQRNKPTAIAVDPSSSDIVYASMGTSSLMVKTVDGGATWSSLTWAGGTTHKIVINPVTGRILTASLNGIYFSDNGGTSWTKAITSVAPGTDVYDIALNPANPSIVYAVSAVNTGSTNDMVMFISTDGGTSFTTATIPSETYCKGARFAVTAAVASLVYCITLQNDVPKLLRSTDNGSSWSVRTTFTGTSLTGSNSNNGMSNGQGFYDLDIMASPADANHVIVGTTSAYKSTDGGLNFSPLGGYHGSFALHPDIQWMTAVGGDAYITTDGGVNYSTDFYTSTSAHEVRNNGLTGSDYWGFGQGWGEDIVVGGRYHNGNAALFDVFGRGNSLRLGGGENATGHVLDIPGESAITGFRDLGNMLRKLPSSINGSVTTTRFVNTKWPSENTYGAFSSKLMQDPRYANIFLVGNGQSLWRSENYGLSYTELKNFGSSVWRFDIARSNPDVIYLCTTNGLHKSTDGGITWQTLSLPQGISYQYYNTDIAVDPADENKVWFCMARGASANKVFKSVNGGATWSNLTGTMLNGTSVAFLAAHGGTDGGIYAITNSNPSKVYYRDATMAEWVDYSDNLPNNIGIRVGGLIFYRDNKLRITGNRGTWESPLYAVGRPLAMPIADRQYISCARDTVTFTDHSILDYSGATWNWSFPGATYISSTNNREVRVSYSTPGNYRVGLTVTDARGFSDTRTIDDMIRFTSDACSVDTVPGKSLVLDDNNLAYEIGTAAINSNSFTISCWFKPNGLQRSFAQLISHDAYPGSVNGYGFGLGFTFSSYTPNLKLCYTDHVVNYNNLTNAIADTTKWNHVALVYSPTGVTIYLNGVGYVARNATMSPIDLSTSPFYINKDIHNQNGYYRGVIDEVKIYNYALTQAEVREKLHLISSEGTSEAGLLKYVQFNTSQANPYSVYELVEGTSIVLPSSSSLATSDAPVGKGVSHRKTVSAGGLHSFGETGLELNLQSSSGTLYPNGEVVVSRIKPLPSYLPGSIGSSHLDRFYVIDNYATNGSFTAPESIRLTGLNLIPGLVSPVAYTLFRRPSFAYGTESWSDAIGRADILSGTSNGDGQLRFPSPVMIGSGQYVVSASDNTMTWVGTTSSDWNTPSNWSPNGTPGMYSSVVIATSPNPPSFSGTATCRQLTVNSGATLYLEVSSILKVYENLTMNGTITGEGTMELNGTVAQTVTGTGTVHNIKVNNTSGGLTIASGANRLAVTGVFTPTSGVTTTNGNLVFRSTATQEGVVGVSTTCPTEPISGDVTVEKHIPGRRAFRLLTPGVTTTGSINANWQEGGSVSVTTGYPYTTQSAQNPFPGYGTHITGQGGSINGFDASVTNNPSLFRYNVSNDAWEAITNTLIANMTSGNGYRIMVRGSRAVDLNNNSAIPDATTLRTTGSLNVCGSVIFNTSSIVPLNPRSDGYSLVGNPYWSVVDWHDVDKSGIEGTMYYWDPTIEGTNNRGAYVSYNALLGLNNNGFSASRVSRLIQPGQAFFVRNTSTSPSLTFSNSDVMSGGGRTGIFGGSYLTGGVAVDNDDSNTITEQKTAAIEQVQVSLFIKGRLQKGPTDGTLICYGDGFTEGYGAEDAGKMTNLDENLSAEFGSQSHSILGLPLSASDMRTDSIPLRMWNLTGREYVLRVTLKGLDVVGEVWLYDRTSGNSTQVKVDGLDYTFVQTAGVTSKVDLVLVVHHRLPVSNEGGSGNLLLYPNPSRSDRVRFAVPMKGLKPEGGRLPSMVDVVDLSGMVRLEKPIVLDGRGRGELEVSALSIGTYVLRVRVGEKVFINKMIRQ